MLGQKPTELNQGCEEKIVTLLQGGKTFVKLHVCGKYLNKLYIVCGKNLQYTVETQPVDI